MNSRVRELRQAAGLSQAGLGEVAGVSRQTINALNSWPALPYLLAEGVPDKEHAFEVA